MKKKRRQSARRTGSDRRAPAPGPRRGTTQTRTALKLKKLNARLKRHVAEQGNALSRSVADARECRKQLAAIADTAIDAVISLDEEQRIILFNAAAETMFGLSAAEALHQPLDRLIPAHLREAHAAHIRRFAESGAPRHRIGERQRLTAVRADGTQFPIEAAISQSVVGGRKIFTVVIRDLSPRLHSLEKVLEHEQALMDFFTAAPLGLMWVTTDGRIERVNQSQLVILGRTSEEVVGAAIAEFHLDRHLIAEILRQVANHETVRNMRTRVLRKDGSIRHVLIDANSLWRRGRPVHSRWFVRDVSDCVGLEVELLAIAERERERIGQELHDDLCQQLTALEYVSETIAGQLEPKLPRAAEAVHAMSRSLRNAIEHAREIARGLFPRTVMSNGGLVLALEELAQRTRRVFQRDCSLRCAAAGSFASESIGIHLFRIAQEAVTNAIRHGNASRIDIELTSLGNDLRLHVRDNGSGLPAQPQTENGMGLRIMQYRAGVINGTLSVQRGPNGGTVVDCCVKDGLPTPAAPTP